MFVRLFRRHTTIIKHVFQDISPQELQQVELILKKVGKRARVLLKKIAIVNMCDAANVGVKSPAELTLQHGNSVRARPD